MLGGKKFKIMDRQEQLKFCKMCVNKKRDLQQGIVCGLTNVKACFEDKCSDFKIDEAEMQTESIVQQVIIEEKQDGIKDILFGALWLFGGLVATLADTGYIFWGAIVFGGFQVLKGILAEAS